MLQNIKSGDLNIKDRLKDFIIRLDIFNITRIFIIQPLLS